MTKKIVIEFFTDGSSKVDAQGFKGQQCSLATRELELALAGDMSKVDDTKKPDFYAPAGVSQGLSNG